MTDRLSLHEKRLLKRYRLLLAHFRVAPVQVRIGELADLMCCTPRYARTLLGDMQKAGWLNWAPAAGRGATGVLRCQVDACALQALLDGVYVVQTDTISAPLPPATVKEAEGDCYTLRFFRPLMKITPSLYTVWPERHLIRMVHVGLMRYEAGGEAPVPGLALAVDVSADRLTWTFHLRRGLVWHSGEAFAPEQLLPALRQRAGGPGLPHVSDVVLSGHTLRLTLSAPDILLPHRLAHPANAFAHPEEDTNGLGPFRTEMQSSTGLTLQRSPFWYAGRPQAARFSFEVIPTKRPDWSTITLESGRSVLPDTAVQTLDGDGGFAFLMFNYARAALTPQQRAVVRRIMQGVAAEIIRRMVSLAELPDGLCVDDCDAEPALLPRELSVVYCRMPETTALIEQLRKSLLWRGCRLNATPRMASHWLLPGEDWSDFDFCVGFQPLGMDQAGMYEEHYRNSPVFGTFLGEEWDLRNRKRLIRAVGGTREDYAARITGAFRTLLRKRIITPLYTQRWRLSVPAEARDVEVFELGWPDFSRIWMP